MTSPFQEKITKVYNALTNKINSSISTHNSSSSSHQDLRNSKISYGQVDSTSTSTVFTATVPNLNELVDGTTVMLRNGVVTSASGFTLNVNNLGAKPVYNSMADLTRDTTIFNIAYTMLFVYDSTRVEGGCWMCYRGYDTNTNTIGYQIRTNSTPYTATDKGYRYRLWLETTDNKYMPVNTSTSTNATANRSSSMNTREFWIGGNILYNNTNGTTNANATMSATTLWKLYTLSLGYSFNNTGSALVMTFPAPVYMVGKPTSNGKARLNTPFYTQTLPSNEDGLIYIYLGHAYSETNIELALDHPVYEYKNNSIRLYQDTYSVDEVDDLLDGKSDINHTHTKSQITDFPNIPTATSDLTNDGDGLHGNFVGESDLGSVAFSNDYDDLDNQPYDVSDLTDNNDTAFTPKSHTHGNLQNDGRVGTSNNASKNVVTDSNGKITTEAKPTIPSASTTVPSADTTNGSYGSGTTYARADHIHPKSSLYAEATHNHTKSQITDFPSIPSKISDLTNDSNFIETSNTNGLIKNDGSIDTSSYITSSAITNHNSSSSAHSSLFNGKADNVHTHSTSDITDLPTIPNNLEDLTLSTGVVQTNTGFEVMSYDDITDILYWGMGKLSLDLNSDEVYYNSYEIATLNDIPVVTGKENSANKVSSWSATTNNTRYPSEKLVKDSLDAKLEVNDLLDLIYPIGSIYMEKDTTSHSVCPIQQTLGGTWTRIQNRFLYASENGQGVNTTGGEATHTLTESELPYIDGTFPHIAHGQNKITGHTVREYEGTTSYEGQASTTQNNQRYKFSFGSGQAHNNMPPYIIVNVWERTA